MHLLDLQGIEYAGRPLQAVTHAAQMAVGTCMAAQKPQGGSSISHILSRASGRWPVRVVGCQACPCHWRHEDQQQHSAHVRGRARAGCHQYLSSLC